MNWIKGRSTVAGFNINRLTYTGLLIFCFVHLRAQHDIPLGQWRSHFSYSSIEHIALTPDKIFASAESAIMVLDREDLSITTLTRLNGLSGSEISSMNADPLQSRVWVGYSDGILDIVDKNKIVSFTRLAEAQLNSSRRINDITFAGSLAYLASDFGVVVFDLNQLDIRETWRDLGAEGSALKIYDSAILGDSIYLATEQGVIAGLLSDNLLDYANWRRYDQNEFSSPVKCIEEFNEMMYAAIDQSGVFRLEDGTWIQEAFLLDMDFNFVTSGVVDLLIGTTGELWSLSTAGQLDNISPPAMANPLDAKEAGQTGIWIGDQESGLINIENGSSQSFVANGPAFTNTFRLHYGNSGIYAVAGGWASNAQPLNRKGQVSYFGSGQWNNETSPLKDITAVATSGDLQYLSSYGQGVQEGPVAAPSVSYNESNSSLINSNPPADFVLVTDLVTDGDRLWATNYNAASPLHLLSGGQWQTFSFPWFASRYPWKLATDFNRSVWYAPNPQQGGGIVVFNQDNNSSSYLTDQTNTGGLPDRRVYSLTTDRDGSMWVGTAGGVAYFPVPSAVFSGNVNAIRPIFENRFLLDGVGITALAVDGGNRKWIGTEQGAWLFGPQGDELIVHFTRDNSPLPSDSVTSIAIDPVSGEVFFGTPDGIVSYRSDATESNYSFDQVKIFPNPVTPDFNGLVGITGLATDAIVKITEVSGKLIYQTNANGGTATWNIRSGTGARVSTGIYLVFSATGDGSERFVGKIAVVE